MIKKTLSIILILLMVFNTFYVNNLPNFADPAWTLSGLNDWQVAYPSNNQNDYLQDQQTGSGTVSQDIVGDGTYPSTYIHFTDTAVSFRVRVNDIDGGTDESSFHFKNFAFVGIDANVNGSIDFFIGAYNPSGSNGRIGIYASSGGYANTSPSTTGISGKPLISYKPSRFVNYAITQAPDSSFNGDSDYFISFSIPVSDITSAVSGLGYTFNKSTPFRFMTGTAAQDNSFNQDLNGMNKTGWSSGATWNTLGVFSGIVSADGTAFMRTVTFDKNTGDTEALPSIKAVSNASALGSLPTPPTKRGMFFQEWNTAPDGTGDKVTSNSVIQTDLTVYALWSDKQVYTVGFDPNGGTLNGSTGIMTIPTINGIIGENMPTSPIKAGSYFMGWNTVASPTGGNPGTWFNSASQVSSNITVYAQWNNQSTKEANFYDNFTPEGGSLIAKIYSNGNSNNFNGGLPSISRQGYTFGGWYLEDKTGIGSPVASISAQGNYYAKWTVANYTITFNENAGTDSVSNMPTDRVVTNGLFGTLPSSPIRAQYEFIEWNRNSNGLGEAMFPQSPVSSSFQVYAIWKASKYVTFNPNGGELDGEANATQSILSVDGQLVYTPQPLTKSGYSFIGWGTSTELSSIIETSTLGQQDNVYALWSPIYLVTFDSNQGNWSDNSTSQVIETAYNSVLYLPEHPTRTGYTFKGWYTDPVAGTEFVLSTEVYQNTTIYAQWNLIPGTQYTVTFVSNGGTAVSSVTTDAISEMPTSIKTGYSLEGWYSDASLDEAYKVTFPMSLISNLTLYAKWTPLSIATKFYANGGAYSDESLFIELNQTFNSTIILPSELPSYLGFTFASWNTSADGLGNLITQETVINSSVPFDVYAIWTEFGNVTIQYTVNDATFGQVTRQSESLNPETGSPEGSLAIPNTGYVFVEWQNSASEQVSLDPLFVPQKIEGLYQTTSYKAIFAPDSTFPYEVVLDDQGGSGGSGSITAYFGLNMPIAFKPVKEGYSFEGYFDAPQGGKAYYSAEMNSLSLWDKTSMGVTLYARWHAHDVQGTIIDDGTPAATLPNATVKLMKGTQQFGSTVQTDVDGKFIITNVPAGTYNLIISLGDKTQIVAITIMSSQALTDVGFIILPLGNASSALKIQGVDTPAIVIGNLHGEAEYYFQDVDPSSFVKVEMVVEKTDLNTATSNGKNDIIQAINDIDSMSNQRGAVLGLYLDLVVERHHRLQEIDPWNFIGNVERTQSLIEIIIPIPVALQNKTDYVIYRYHQGSVNEITSSPNSDGEYLILDTTEQTLKMYVRNFSVYALGYFDPTLIPVNNSTPQPVLVADVVDPTPVVSLETISANRIPYMLGYPDHTFRPENFMTRAEATVMFARLLKQNQPNSDKYTNEFIDVKLTDWFYDDISYMSHLKLINGYTDGSFRPNDFITRAEFAVLASKFDALESTDSMLFSDVTSLHWASASISSASHKGWIIGYPDGTFKPENHIKRSEVVTLVNRVLTRNFDKTLLEKYPHISTLYSDLIDAYWAFYDILEASVSDQIIGKE